MTRMHRLLIATLGSLLAGVCLPALAQTTRPTTAPVEAAIGRLSADDWKARQSAQNDLVHLGEEAVPRLRELADGSTNPEVRSRAAAALKSIGEARELGPSMLTIHLRNSSPQTVFNEIARQGHTQFNTWPGNLWSQRAWPRIDVDVENKPFWEVVRDVCSRSGCHLQQIGNSHRLSIAAGSDGWMNGPLVNSGPFTIVARNISRSSNVDLGQAGNVQQDFSVGFVVLAEPKLRIMQSSYDAEVESAIDDNGATLAAPNAGPIGELLKTNNFPYNITARLNPLAPAGGKKIARLKCSARFVIETQHQTLEVPDLLAMKNLTKSTAGRRILVRSVQKTGDQYSLAITLFRDSLDRPQWEQFRNPSGEIQVIDARGNALLPRGWSGGGNDTEMQYTFEFAREANGGDERPGEPDKLVWDIPMETRAISIPFEFHDLPLP